MKRKNILIALAASLTVCVLLALGVRRLDRTQDTLFQRSRAVDDRIVLIGIDEETLSELGPYHTWTRSIMASALEALAADPEQMPCVVAVDTLYIGGTSPEDDNRLARAAAALPAVITATKADLGYGYEPDGEGGLRLNRYAVLGYETPYPELRDATVQGHINTMYDTDGVMRHAVYYVDVPEQGRVYSMAWQAAQAWARVHGTELQPPDTDALGRFYVAFSGKPGAYYDDYSLLELIRGEIPADVFSDRIVLIGPYAAALQDAYFTPISQDRQMYGVELQANVIDAYLHGRYRTVVPVFPQALVTFLAGFLCMLLFLKGKTGAMGILAAVLAALSVGASLVLYEAGYVTHPLYVPAAIAVMYIVSVAQHYVQAAMERQRVTRTFERYVAPEVVQEILKQGTDGLRLGGNLCHIAVLFVDIRGFTTMSEHMEPQSVVHILNRYLSLTSSCVERNHGTLDKFVGDATMAFWGAPLARPDPVYEAACAAMDIVKDVAELSESLYEETGQHLQVGVGVHYGAAVVGNMGSEKRMDYTAIGDTVNTAARLESNAPGGKIYISRAVADMLGSRAGTTSLGDTVRLKGKAEGFEVLTLDSLIR